MAATEHPNDPDGRPRPRRPELRRLATYLRRWEDRPRPTLADGAVFLFWLAVWSVQVMARYAAPGDAYLSFFADDFFYYVAPAEQLIRTGVPTFDGVVATNGYQPLWFIVIVALLSITGGPSRLFFVAVSLTTIGLLSVAYLQARRIGLRLLESSLLATACAFYFIVGCSGLAFDGMELPLVVCLGVSLVARLLHRPLPAQGRSQLAVTGLLAALVVLARLDAALFVGLYLLLVGLRLRFSRAWLRSVACFALGGLLVPVYLLASWAVFGVPIPVSGLAKHLKQGWVPALGEERLLFFGLEPANWVGAVFTTLYLYPCYLAVLGLGWCWVTRHRAGGEVHRPLVVSLLLFPLVSFALQLGTSDWIFWDWYYYPLFVAWPLLLVVALRGLRPRSRPSTLAAAVLWLLTAPGLLLLRGDQWLSWSASSIRQEALAIARFMAAHDGAYAMGDRAGMVRMYSRRRLVQAEGLMMDSAFLEQIRRQRDLVAVLRGRGVRYYVMTRSAEPRRDGAGCLIAQEPSVHVAGPSSCRMSGRLCRPPVFRLEGRHTVVRIFDLDRERVVRTK